MHGYSWEACFFLLLFFFKGNRGRGDLGESGSRSETGKNGERGNFNRDIMYERIEVKK